ncbi:MAG: hypothetical protein KKF44_01950 [Nanoarchaeota archaeon]|nr:hypothetical protein [Nanoarchaeota archaeon]
MASTFRDAIAFMDNLGIYDVVLPFLLIFTTVFAILEKSKIFGTEVIEDITVTRKNLNSMFAFVTAFLTVASTQLVATINQALAHIALLLLLAVSFLLLVGTFHSGSDPFKLDKDYNAIFMIIMFVGTLLIFLNAIKTEDGVPWLVFAWEWVMKNFTSGAFGALVLTIVIVVIMSTITAEPSKNKSGFLGFGGKKEEEEK